MNQYIRPNKHKNKNFVCNEWINTYEQRNIKKINEYTRTKKHKEKILPEMNESMNT